MFNESGAARALREMEDLRRAEALRRMLRGTMTPSPWPPPMPKKRFSVLLVEPTLPNLPDPVAPPRVTEYATFDWLITAWLVSLYARWRKVSQWGDVRVEDTRPIEGMEYRASLVSYRSLPTRAGGYGTSSSDRDRAIVRSTIDRIRLSASVTSWPNKVPVKQFSDALEELRDDPKTFDMVMQEVDRR